MDRRLATASDTFTSRLLRKARITSYNVCYTKLLRDKTLRDVHRFGFLSLSKMKDEADKHLSVALALIGQYPAVAGL